jgi:signal transduction histidine kinase
VFNSIVQFDANKLQGGGGSGIGLWVTKKIVVHGGRVRFELAPGVGSNLILEIAISREPSDESGKTRPTEIASTTIHSSGTFE